MTEHRGSWYLLTGLIIGLVIGLVYGWIVQPPVSTETNLSTMKEEYKDEYRVLIAQAYAANEDLVRARARLEVLDGEISYQHLEQMAQRYKSSAGYESDAQALARLAADLKAGY